MDVKSWFTALWVLGAWLWPHGEAHAACDSTESGWLACEDFEAAGAGWSAWFSQSPFVECLGCADGDENPQRIYLSDDPEHARDGQYGLHLPADAAADYQGASLTFRSCSGDKTQGCSLTGYDELYFRTWVKLADDHQYVHHFLSIAGTQPDEYWGADGNAGCRPNGFRAAGTTLDFDENRELFFYTYFPEMGCDSGGYCDGQYAQDICSGCADKDMPCTNGLECCWGNHFSADEPVVLPRGEWVCLELMMRLNTPGEADGVMAFWMDDELGHEQTGMRWRDVPELQLNKAWLQHYVASGDADQSNRISFDDVVVSTERIGCGGLPGGSDSDGGTGGDDGGPSGNSDSGSPPPQTTGSDDANSSGANDDGSSSSDSGLPADDMDSSNDGCGCSSGGGPKSMGVFFGLLLLLPAVPRRRRSTCA